MGAKYVKYTYTPGAPGVLVIRQRSTGYLRDDTDGSFTATPAINYSVATEDSDIPGLYSWTTSDVWTDDYYEAYWYTTSALTSTCKLLGVIQLVGDEEVSQTATLDLAAIAEAVRDVDNSTPAAGSLGYDAAAAAAKPEASDIAAAVRDVDNSAPAAGSLGEDAATAAMASGVTVQQMIDGGIARESTLLNGIETGVVVRRITTSGKITLVRGDVETLTFRLGTEFPLSTRKAIFTVKSKATDTTFILSEDCTTTDAVNGVCTFTTAEDSFPDSGRFVFDVQVVDVADGANPRTAQKGALIVLQDVKQ